MSGDRTPGSARTNRLHPSPVRNSFLPSDTLPPPTRSRRGRPIIADIVAQGTEIGLESTDLDSMWLPIHAMVVAQWRDSLVSPDATSANGIPALKMADRRSCPRGRAA